jgi:hypothetical protein
MLPSVSAPTVYGVGVVSIGYAGQNAGALKTYDGGAEFFFNTPVATGVPLDLTLPRDSWLGEGFESAELLVGVNTGWVLKDTFTSLAQAETFFSNFNTIDLGSFRRGDTIVDVTFYLTDNMQGDGFGFTYCLNSGKSCPNQPIPESSTWVMAVLGFAGIGFAGYRSGAKKRANAVAAD